MIVLDLSNPFEFEVRNTDGTSKVLSGTLRELTPAEKEKNKKLNKENDDLVKKSDRFSLDISRKNTMIEIKRNLGKWEEVEALTIELDTIQDQFQALVEKERPRDRGLNVIKDKVLQCLGGADREEIIKYAEAVGYGRVLSVIYEAIEEKKNKQ